MQRKWRLDEDKLTFIILARNTEESPREHAGSRNRYSDISNLPMVGDVNLFLKGTPPNLKQSPRIAASQSADPDENEEEDFEGELEIMIAMPYARAIDAEFRRKGLAYEALRLLISYATDSEDSAANYPKRPPQLPIPRSSLVVRVSQFNTPSIQLFERMGMRIVKRVEVFQEVEMR
ncbi:hypothetical protein HWV62_39746 [Athelia sp. TMB]|nr:hypothetical protein HWV62_39746 [Athelia sp. TMB]